MAESSAMLNKTLAMGINMMFSTMQQQQQMQPMQQQHSYQLPQPIQDPRSQHQPAQFQPTSNTFQRGQYLQPVQLQYENQGTGQGIQPAKFIYWNEEPQASSVLHNIHE